MQRLLRLIGFRDSEVAQKARLSPEDPTYYEQWAKAEAQNYNKNINTALGQLLTLSTSLFGGTIAFWDRMPFDTPFRYATIASLLCTVIVCLLSAMPIAGDVDFKKAGEIREYMEEVSARKRRRLLIAKCSLIASLVLAAGGTLAAGIYGCPACSALASRNKAAAEPSCQDSRAVMKSGAVDHQSLPGTAPML
ncbi:hypothetical protein [Rhizobium sp. Rhizsp42]|uniref:hypothetical protein n=1 Tax=Rhizobium sp. Rhizsp42 TaxID=3243034 RepID=UPI0039B0B34B